MTDCPVCHGRGYYLDDPVGEPGHRAIEVPCDDCDGAAQALRDAEARADLAWQKWKDAR